MYIDALPTPIKFAKPGMTGLRKLVTLISAWYWDAKTRRELVGLDARELRDIGLTEYDRRRECAKPFWH